MRLFFVPVTLFFLLGCLGETEPPETAPEHPTNPPAAASGVTCSVFEGNIIGVTERFEISLDTDLPDDTELMVTVSRTFKAETDEEGVQEYLAEYLSEKNTVWKWKRKQFVDVSDEKLEAVLNEDLRRIRGAGFRYDILDGSISDDIEVSFVVPTNQSNPAFGNLNSKLMGSMVELSGSARIIRWQKLFYMPYAQRRNMFSRSQTGPPTLNYRIVKTEPYDAWIAGRFQTGAKIHVVPDDWERVEHIAKSIARSEASRGVVVYFWKRPGDVGIQPAVFGVELIDGKITETLVDQR